MDELLNGFPGVWLQGLKWFALVAAFLMLLGLLFVMWNQRRARRNTSTKVRQQFNGAVIHAMAADAYFCGMERNWDNEWRGAGVLLLTDEMLYFRLCGSSLDLNIPVDRVQAAEVGYGKKPFRPSKKGLKVIYQGAGGNLRFATWLVRNPQNWVHLLEGHIKEAMDNGPKA